jgi:FtsZ-interacting cell division protein ZipA
MSDLQIVLIILGAVIIAAVVIYNWLQERKLRENITDEFIVPQKDVLVEEFYLDADALVEKEFADDVHKAEIVDKLNTEEEKTSEQIAEAGDQVALSDDEIINADNNEHDIANEVNTRANKEHQIEPSVAAKIDELAETAAKNDTVKSDPKPTKDFVAEKNILPAEFEPIAKSSLPDNVHTQIDLTAFLFASKSINAKAFFDTAKTTMKGVGAFISLHGLDEQGVWHIIDDTATDAQSYRRVSCSLQLADRRGPVPKPVLNKFQFAIETIGLEFNAHVDWQSKQDPAERAIDLDKFCMDVDQLVSIHIKQGDTPIHGTKFKGLAEANGLKLVHSQFRFFDDSTADTPQFILVNADNQPFTPEGLRNNVVTGATFQIEIPKVKNCEQTFNEMVVIAQQMANSLGARIVDDHQKPLGELQIEKIRQQLKVIHATMVARGIMPGSDSSMRLFN